MPLPVRLAHFALDQVPSFSAFLPYLAYEPDHKLYLLTKDADPTHLAWGVCFECVPHPGPGEKQATNLKGIFELMWPPGSTIQISALGLQTETIPRLLHYRSLRQPGIHSEFATRRVQRLATLLLSGNHAIQTAPLRDVTILVSATIPVTPIRTRWWQRLHRVGRAAMGQGQLSQCETILAAAPQAARLSLDIEQLLTQAALAPRRVTPERLLTLLFPLLNPNHPYHAFTHVEPDRELRRQMVMADTQILPQVDGAQIDGWFFRSLSPLQFPPEFSIDRMESMTGDLINPTQQIPTSFLLTLNGVTYDRADAQRSLQRKFAIISQQAVGPMARIIPRLGLKSEHYAIAMHALEQGTLPISAYLHLVVWAPSVAEANHAVAASEAIWRAHNFVPQHDGPASLNLIRESLPMALSSNSRYLERDLSRARTILSSNCASLAPIAGDWKGTGRPILLMVSRRGQLAGLDIFCNPAGNYNGLVAGLSGGGKSVLMNDLVLGLLGCGAQVWIIDKGRSYEKMVQTLKGDYLVFHTDSPINLNPFSFIDSPKEFEDRISGLKALLAQMASPSRPITDFEDSRLGQAMQEAFHDHGHTTTITHIAEILAKDADQRCSDLAHMLYPYTARGEYARFFEGQATINVMESHLLLLELEELSTKPKLQSVIFLALVLAVQAAMERGDRATKKIVLTDEAWQFLSSPQAARFMTELVRRARKYAMGCIQVTQSLLDLCETEAGAAILENSDTRWIYPHRAEALRDPRIALNPYEISLIRSLTKVSGKYAECYISHPSGSGVYRHIIDPVAYWLFTTHAEEVAKLNTLMKTQGLALTEAIATLIEDDHFEHPIPPHIASALQ